MPVVKIMILTPTGLQDADKTVAEMARDHKDSNTLVTVASLASSAGDVIRLPTALECPSAMCLLHVDLVKACYQARRERYDAFIVDCMDDLALDELRSISGDMVVIGPTQSAVQTALRLGNRYSIIIDDPIFKEVMEKQPLRRLGPDQLPVSYRSIDMSYHGDQKELETQLFAQSKLAVESDGAEVVILGCTLARGWYQSLQQRLDVPVIDGSIKLAEMSAHMKIRFGWRGVTKSPTDEELKRANTMQEPYVFSGRIDVE
ncbi:Asp/Glu/hydantoin racemase [Penicillium griseofulvum]|uniref:Asp/Glu/hydantoin racemase n=1 Tax=Penicillium patulum TaxID=5078 RepID=A0A135LKA2_PENPA|nr:Asp/Glu/hydantoin racemase [Penicillium griseofulvum]KXG49364.1 Asp/Glu/hydantoin racemase [Penicillium griseofulvum]